MSRRSVRKNLAIVTIVLLSCRVAADVLQASIGSANLALPIPEGYFGRLIQNDEFGRAVKEGYPLAPPNFRIAMFFRTADFAGAGPAFDGSPMRTFDIQTIDISRTRDATLSYFTGEKNLIKTKLNETIAQTQTKRDALLRKAYGETPDYQTTVIPPFYETERAIAYSTLWTVTSTGAHGQKHTFEHAITCCSLLLRGKILILYVRGAKEELEWTQIEAVKYAQVLENENPSSGLQTVQEKTGIGIPPALALAANGQKIPTADKESFIAGAVVFVGLVALMVVMKGRRAKPLKVGPH